ncbi:MAG: hypothetical protein KF819_31760, partial [Labilithrix sp.]|nr:hypothetical protein [Labilithrix sp.]
MTGCLGDPKVVRVYDGRVVEGRYVSPDAYAAFLRGVLAEESGDWKGALSAYEQARNEDEDDAEVWARIGAVRCRLDVKDTEIDRAFGRAAKIDPTYASALAARSRCELSRGRPEEAAALARAAAAADPKNAGLEALYVTAEAARRGPSGARERAVALTLAHGSRAVAWDALVAWGRSHRDAELVARGLEGLVRAAPGRSAEVEKGA